MRYPVDYIGVTQPFKNEGENDDHFGLDLGWNTFYGGKHVRILSADDGTIHSIQVQKTGGNVIIIKHSHGFTEYGHLEDGSIQVKVGQKVKMGDYIANMGDTGYVQVYDKKKKKWVWKQVANHLHYGYYKADTFSYNVNKWVDPMKYTEVYPNQTVADKTKKAYGSKLIYHTDAKTKYVYNVDDEGLVVHYTPSGRDTGERLKAGTEVTVYETQGYWSKIGDNKWVFRTYLSDKKPKTKVVYNVKKPPLLVHIKPSIDSKVVGELYNGDTVQVYATKKGWVKVSKQEERWTAGNYLK